MTRRPVPLPPTVGFTRVFGYPLWVVGLAVLGAVVGVGYVLFRTLGSPAPVPVVQPLMTVSVVRPTPGNLAQAVEFNGTLVPREDAVVSTELSGVRVREVRVDEGQQVHEGEVLALLDPATLRNQAAQLQADFARAEDAYQRVEAISTTGAVSREDIRQKQTAMAAARAQYANARLNISRTTVVAPRAGVVYQRNIQVGQLVGASDVMFRIATLGRVELEASIPEEILPRLFLDASATLVLTGMATPVSATLRVISPRVDAANRTALVRLALPDDVFVPIGTFGRATLRLANPDGDLLPSTAVQQGPSGTFVWGVLPNNTVTPLPVDLRQQANGQVLVAPLRTTLPIVSLAGAFLRAGDLVSPRWPRLTGGEI